MHLLFRESIPIFPSSMILSLSRVDAESLLKIFHCHHLTQSFFQLQHLNIPGQLLKLQNIGAKTITYGRKRVKPQTFLPDCI